MNEKKPEDIMRQVLALEKELKQIKSRTERPIPVVRDRQGRMVKELTLKGWFQKLNEEVDELKEICLESYTLDSSPAKARVIVSPFFQERQAEEISDIIKVLYSMAAQMGIDGDDLDRSMYKWYGGLTMAEIDETIITNAFFPLPARWKCPHCGAVSRLDEEAVEILIKHFKVIRHCGRCGHLHVWIFRLTEDFKKKVVEYLFNGGMANDIRRTNNEKS